MKGYVIGWLTEPRVEKPVQDRHPRSAAIFLIREIRKTISGTHLIFPLRRGLLHENKGDPIEANCFVVGGRFRR
jgi:hypothetical protein